MTGVRCRSCGEPATRRLAGFALCESHYRFRLAKDRREQADRRRGEAARAQAAVTPEWSSPRLAALAANAERWDREEYEQYLRDWHKEVLSHRTKQEPSRARERRQGTGRVTVLS